MKYYTLTALAFLFAFLSVPDMNIHQVQAEGIIPTTFLPIVLKDAFFPTITFDERDEPCAFINTIALRDEYIASGVLFASPQPLDGGGILNECGNFDVFGYSPPNFLAFNKESQYSDGGIPQTPQIIAFENSVSSVTFKTGSSFAGELLTLRAFDAADNKIAEASIALMPTLETITVTSPGIQYVIIDSDATYFVIDDLSWNLE